MKPEELGQGSHRIQFGVFEADLERGELSRFGARVRLQSQPFKLLAALLEHPGEIVNRKELQQQLWGADTTVDFDHGLGVAVKKLRDALGDSAENPRYVETVAKQGYRFIAPVARPVKVEPEAPAQTSGPAAQADSGPVFLPAHKTDLRWRWIAAVLACVCLVLGVWGTTLTLRSPIRKPYRVEQITYSGRVLPNDLDVESFSSPASDGTRIYFTHVDNGDWELAVALTANGEINEFHLPAEIGAPLICSLSPDGSKLLVRSQLQAEAEQPLWIMPTLGGDARRIPGVLAHDATWMPDGHRVLVASENKLITMETDGSDARQLATTPGRAFWLRWSPDGQRLRFTLRDPKRQTSELWEASANGSNLHPLFPGWSHPASECCGSWTSDGEYFVFQSLHNGHSEIWVRREQPWLLREAEPRPITNGPLSYQAPTTSPGSHRIYFIGADVQVELLRALPKSSSFSILGQTLSSALLAEYSADGRWVAWLNASDGSLWRSRIDGSERIELTNRPLWIFSMKWSPDDKRLALMAEEPGKPWKIYLIDAEGGKLTPIVNEDRNEADPDWSPDGHSIAFGRLPERMDNGGPKAIHVVNLLTHQVTEIPGSTGLFCPRFSPDGRYIAAVPLDQRGLRLFDRTQSRWTPLTTHGVGDPVWSHDSHYLYFQDFLEDGKPIYRIAVPAGQPESVATINNLRPIAATDYRLIGLGPDDLPVVSARTSSVNLYSVNLNEP